MEMILHPRLELPSNKEPPVRLSLCPWTNNSNNNPAGSSSSSSDTPIYLNVLSPPNRPSRKLNSNATTTNHRRTQSSSTKFRLRTLNSGGTIQQTNPVTNTHKIERALLDDDDHQSERMDIDPNPPSVLPTPSITTNDRVANPSLNCSISSGFKSTHHLNNNQSCPASGIVSDDELTWQIDLSFFAQHTSGTLKRLLFKLHADEVKPPQATPEVHSGTIAKLLSRLWLPSFPLNRNET
ncbi:hypothetical protein Pst134EA_009589 [Puccinia striiformis f. sp. tritici]|uniref:hypothetical protein n=1 Tax=Puccinia striiformis f. sp. tritici TaxID=168172 RepID=UPI002008C462|nr:hypothetical protein Pst134EA_009589 [Puccinia striiformis f. sp. tritici]KAH9458360.1 hypothetical protein Pst134EB_010664 [Puccinia striiformis f. sp. tritici]KAH9469066.1 hypothetical protein Pst134EA_009589 [Puccinia striiformis f. sp. tritici]